MIAEAVVQVPRVDVQYVDEECSLMEEIGVEPVVYNQVTQIQEQVVKGCPMCQWYCDAKYRPPRQFRNQWRFHKCSSLIEWWTYLLWCSDKCH